MKIGYNITNVTYVAYSKPSKFVRLSVTLNIFKSKSSIFFNIISDCMWHSTAKMVKFSYH